MQSLNQSHSHYVLFFFFIILKHDSVFCLNIHLYNVNDSLFDFTLQYQDQIPSLNSQCKTFFPVFYLCHVYVIDFFNPGKYKSKDRVVGCHWFELFKVLIKSAVSNVYMYIDIFTNVASAISNYMQFTPRCCTHSNVNTTAWCLFEFHFSLNFVTYSGCMYRVHVQSFAVSVHDMYQGY